MPAAVFIDGRSGSAGLEISERLSQRADLELMQIDPERRKDAELRAECLNGADIAILCLPDKAAVEAVAMIKNPRVKVIDASSAHRVADGWTYGFAECAPGQRELIAEATRIANPGCYASGAVALLAPLVRTGLVPPDYPLALFGLSGYSGGGRGMIAEFEDEETAAAARLYALDLDHKHLPEITRHAHLHHLPVFTPIVGAFRRGMLVTIPLHAQALPAKTNAERLREALADAYLDEPMIRVLAGGGSATRLHPALDTPSDRLDIHVFGCRNRIALVAHLDNLGKGAAGAAVQNLNLALGLPESGGLRLPSD